MPFLFCLCLCSSFGGYTVKACSVFTASCIDMVLAATNKDWNNPQTRIRFYAPSEGKYGRVYFGYQVSDGFQNVGGMNEHGLWYDGASLPHRSDIHNHFNKPTIKGELCEKALEECRTVEEVIQLYTHFYTPHWQGHSMWADRMGNSVIIEYGEKDVIFLRKEHAFQVMTNFYLSDSTNLRWSRCHRYHAIHEVLEKGKEFNVELMTQALKDSHKEGLTPTLFSNVYDLRKGEIYVYHFHYYGEYVHINLKEELLKGDQYLDLPQLFSRIHLKYPSPDLELDAQEVCFEWSGGVAEYEIHYSLDPEFQESTILKAHHPDERETKVLAYQPLWILLLVAWRMKKHKKQLGMMLLGCMLLGSCSACSKLFVSPEFPDTIDYSVQVKNLIPGKTYHWKVLAQGADGLNSESRGWTFTTKE